jgi:hypothetical protein
VSNRNIGNKTLSPHSSQFDNGDGGRIFIDRGKTLFLISTKYIWHQIDISTLNSAIDIKMMYSSITIITEIILWGGIGHGSGSE